MANAFSTGVSTLESDFAPAGHVGSAARPDFEVEIVHSIEDAQAPWRELEAAITPSPFQTFDWHRLERDAGAASDQPVIVVGRKPDGSTLFLLPLAIDRHGPFQTLVWLAGDQASYGAGLFHPDAHHVLTPDATQHLVSRLRDLVPQTHALMLRDQRDDNDNNPLRHLPHIPGASEGYCVTLAPWGVLYAARGNRRTRHNDRRREKRFAEIAPWKVRFAETPAERERLMEILFAQKRVWLADRGIFDFLANKKTQALYMSTVNSPEPLAFEPVVASLEAGGETTAVGYGLTHRDCHYLLITSVQQDSQFIKYSPGDILFRHMLKAACDAELEVFDLGLGTNRQKEQYADRTFEVFHTMVPLRSAGRLYIAAMNAKANAKRTIKENPKLWEMFQRARRTFGSRNGADDTGGSDGA